MGRRLKTYGVNVDLGTIATTSNTDKIFIVPKSGTVSGVFFSGNDVLATSDTNYITFVLTNLGQTGSGTAAPLATTPAGVNTTKVTGGAAIAANTKKTLTLSATATDLAVVEGDRVRVRAAATGTLANTVTVSNIVVLIDANGQ